MAFRVRITSQPAGTQLAVRDLPDAVAPRIQAIFPSAQAALDWMLLALREHVRNEQVRLVKEDKVPLVTAAGDAEEVAFAGDWPT